MPEAAALCLVSGVTVVHECSSLRHRPFCYLWGERFDPDKRPLHMLTKEAVTRKQTREKSCRGSFER